MRKDPLITNMYYHVYNRGVDKRDIFINKDDLNRFILSLKVFNTLKPKGGIKNSLQEVPDVRHREPLVSFVCYTLNPNHFHFILKQEVDGGISEFLKRVLGGYTKYFNIKYNRSGFLFQGKFKSKLIKDDEYFLKIRPYVHMNYLMHNIPKEKQKLIFSSENEYDKNKFEIISSNEAKELLEFYGNNKNFKKECVKILSFIREERGKTSLLEEDFLF